MTVNNTCPFFRALDCRLEHRNIVFIEQLAIEASGKAGRRATNNTNMREYSCRFVRFVALGWIFKMPNRKSTIIRTIAFLCQLRRKKNDWWKGSTSRSTRWAGTSSRHRTCSAGANVVGANAGIVRTGGGMCRWRCGLRASAFRRE